MTAFLEALGGKLAERWLALLLVPGALLMVVAAAGARLGHAHWNDIGLLLSWLNRLSGEPAMRSTGTLILVLVGLLAASAGLGLAAALGRGIERAVLGTWPTRAANARRNRISLARPAHPFWLGDRIAAVDTRVWETYRLDLTSAWPRLWLTLPEDVRTEITTARARLADATRLVAWAVGYVAVGVVWWPSLVAGVVTAATAWRRARVAGVTYAELTESTVDLHGRRLAEGLGLPCPGPLTKAIGEEITTLLRKQT